MARGLIIIVFLIALSGSAINILGGENIQSNQHHGLTYGLLGEANNSDPKIHAAFIKAISDAVIKDLRSQDSDRINDANEFLKNKATPSLCRSILLGSWLTPLLEIKEYDIIQILIDKGFSNGWGETTGVASLQDCRVQLLLATGKYDEAVAAAKGYYNVCRLQDTERAIQLVCTALKNANGESGKTVSERFRAEQVAGADIDEQVDPINDESDNTLRGIHVDGRKFEPRIVKSRPGAKTYDNFTALGNLLLLADHPDEALLAFDRALSLAQPKQMEAAVENVARGKRAKSGIIGPANSYIISVREGIASDSVGPMQAALHPSQVDIIHVPIIEIAGTQANHFVTAESAESLRPYVMSMCTDHQGKIWIGTEDGGVQSFDPAARKFHEWTSYTVDNGLGDNNGYAITCDRKGRIWVGHVSHGVSVFNGVKWQNYDVVGGTSHAESLSGPLGERVFDIAVCPVDGDVWIATNAGITRYSEKDDKWNYYSRAEGLPADSTDSIAFDQDGNVYIGMQNDGIAIARRDSEYKVWRQVKGPAAVPIVSFGSGLPSRMVNDVLVAQNGTVYVGTPAGLAWSRDHGVSWQFIRGKDWRDKVIGSTSGPPAGFTAGPDGLLAEDYITRLSEDSGGRIYIGHRHEGLEVLQRVEGEQGLDVVSRLCPNLFVSAIAQPMSKGIVGTYGHGVVAIEIPAPNNLLTGHLTEKCDLPRGADPPSLAQMNALLDAIATVVPSHKISGPLVLPLDDDWRTEGDWLGRYGRYWATIAAINSPKDYQWGAGAEQIKYIAQLGPHHDVGDTLRYFIAYLYTDSPSSLELPPIYLDSRVAKKLTVPNVNRRQAQWDDHGEAYPQTYEGPDIYCTLTVPRGLFALSLYAMNKGGKSHIGHLKDFTRAAWLNNSRDFDLSVRAHVDGDFNDISGFDRSDELASGRINQFWHGVYKRFLVQGPTDLTVKVARNYSGDTILEGVMLDLMEERPVPYFKPSQGHESVLGGKIRVLGSESADTVPLNNDKSILFYQHEGDAAQAIIDKMEEMREKNPEWWAIRLRTIMIPLARWYHNNVDSPQSTRNEGTCFYWSQLYAQWETCQEMLGEHPAREIEKALRWDGVTPSYSGNELSTIVSYLSSGMPKAVFPADNLNAPPSSPPHGSQ